MPAADPCGGSPPVGFLDTRRHTRVSSSYGISSAVSSLSALPVGTARCGDCSHPHPAPSLSPRGGFRRHGGVAAGVVSIMPAAPAAPNSPLPAAGSVPRRGRPPRRGPLRARRGVHLSVAVGDGSEPGGWIDAGPEIPPSAHGTEGDAGREEEEAAPPAPANRWVAAVRRGARAVFPCFGGAQCSVARRTHGKDCPAGCTCRLQGRDARGLSERLCSPAPVREDAQAVRNKKALDSGAASMTASARRRRRRARMELVLRRLAERNEAAAEGDVFESSVLLASVRSQVLSRQGLADSYSARTRPFPRAANLDSSVVSLDATMTRLSSVGMARNARCASGSRRRVNERGAWLVM
eukprot:TRINITY_DN12887_c0_g1_i1.p1 TRINITY_DN12887_c0_g1~~TRINITY_DN12887_c0_g1_i1.p1  ORF type:complete len:352 (+),score=53.66 TRINITY_DN12887_c0_g1_i1:72-1127(+)